tara:strand:+ start:76 stop:306 length:231 start_codon:yes stop_codon:yes gene_type:complete
MPNDQANDRYNPPGIGDSDFEPMRFDEIEEEDLFWLNESIGDNNPPYRKLNDTQGYNTRTGIVDDFVYNANVFMRT